MEELIYQERFEIEVLEKLNSGRFLDTIVFYGGTMLRLCYGLDRFSTDLDFFLLEEINSKEYFNLLYKFFSKNYIIKDRADKRNTILFEIGKEKFKRGLKIEIRKEVKGVVPEKMISYSPYSTTQVILNTAKLKDMMTFKIEAFLDRGEIRDAYDIEFLLKKGVSLNIGSKESESLIKKLNGLTEKDFKMKLFPLIDKEKRDYYLTNRFKILNTAL
ncbi:nucleotidyl transferase AbiEii/AbiGii toxin family protein [bacterium]|nr:nucleotidyl transferase AbiEii/AbiGii toxin family protein [bacterium]